MAPDLNTMPPSPRPLASSPRLTSRSTSRRTSTQIAQPALPPTSPSLNILPSNQNAVNHSSPPLASPNMATIATGTAGVTVGDNTGVGTGPGPLRHPRPLTAADLHLQLEKEQEAVVIMLKLAQTSSMLRNATGQPINPRTVHAPSSTERIRRIQHFLDLRWFPRYWRSQCKPPSIRSQPPGSLTTPTPPLLIQYKYTKHYSNQSKYCRRNSWQHCPLHNRRSHTRQSASTRLHPTIHIPQPAELHVRLKKKRCQQSCAIKLCPIQLPTSRPLPILLSTTTKHSSSPRS
jgi:hypothetical protein